jgi:hypothetical protein
MMYSRNDRTQKFNRASYPKSLQKTTTLNLITCRARQKRTGADARYRRDLIPKDIITSDGTDLTCLFAK